MADRWAEPSKRRGRGMMQAPQGEEDKRRGQGNKVQLTKQRIPVISWGRESKNQSLNRQECSKQKCANPAGAAGALLTLTNSAHLCTLSLRETSRSPILHERCTHIKGSVQSVGSSSNAPVKGGCVSRVKGKRCTRPLQTNPSDTNCQSRTTLPTPLLGKKRHQAAPGRRSSKPAWRNTSCCCTPVNISIALQHIVDGGYSVHGPW